MRPESPLCAAYGDANQQCDLRSGPESIAYEMQGDCASFGSTICENAQTLERRLAEKPLHALPLGGRHDPSRAPSPSL
jgi:hypothetical protein